MCSAVPSTFTTPPATDTVVPGDTVPLTSTGEPIDTSLLGTSTWRSGGVVSTRKVRFAFGEPSRPPDPLTVRVCFPSARPAAAVFTCTTYSLPSLLTGTEVPSTLAFKEEPETPCALTCTASVLRAGLPSSALFFSPSMLIEPPLIMTTGTATTATATRPVATSKRGLRSGVRRRERKFSVRDTDDPPGGWSV